MIQHKEDFSDVGITNDFMFGYVMQDEERCRKFLEQILGIRIQKVVKVQRQKDISLKIDTRGVRLDIYVDDGKTIYNCEMQTGNTRNLPRRSRYYQGNIDLDMLAKGADFSELKDSFVIFICNFDPFGKGRCLYRFSNHCDEDQDIVLQDGAMKVFVNTKGKIGETDEEFRELIQYMDTSEIPFECKNSLVYELDQALVEARNNQKWRDSFMTWEIYGEDKRWEGRQEGLQEGRQEGLQEGRQEGLQEGRQVGQQEGLRKAQIVFKMIYSGKSKEEAAIASGLTVQEVEELMQ